MTTRTAQGGISQTTPIATSHFIRNDLARQGYSLVKAADISISAAMHTAWESIRAEYSSLPADEFLPDGGAYRYRRYDRFYFHPATGELHLLPHGNYFQDTDINAVTGGIVRSFEPLSPETVANPFLRELIRFDFANFPQRDAEQGQHPWQVDVHQIHVVAQPDELGLPTPEGVHRDGAQFVTVHLAQIDNTVGGLVKVYDDDKTLLAGILLRDILDTYVLDDTSRWHGASPIRSSDGVRPAQRGILTFDFHYTPGLRPPG